MRRSSSSRSAASSAEGERRTRFAHQPLLCGRASIHPSNLPHGLSTIILRSMHDPRVCSPHGLTRVLSRGAWPFRTGRHVLGARCPPLPPAKRYRSNIEIFGESVRWGIEIRSLWWGGWEGDRKEGNEALFDRHTCVATTIRTPLPIEEAETERFKRCRPGWNGEMRPLEQAEG